MIIYSLLVDILKYTVAGIGVVSVAFYLARPYLDRNESLQLAEIKKSLNAQTLPLRLQGYERIVLFIERINPASLLVRINGPYDAHELHSLIITEIRNEFQHNVTQQIYVSAKAWQLVKRVKDDTLAMVNSAARSMPENASGLDLSKTILSHVSKLENNPYDIALEIIRADLADLF